MQLGCERPVPRLTRVRREATIKPKLTRNNAHEGKSGKNPIVLNVIAPDNARPYRRKTSLPSILRRLSTTLDSVLQDRRVRRLVGETNASPNSSFPKIAFPNFSAGERMDLLELHGP